METKQVVDEPRQEESASPAEAAAERAAPETRVADLERELTEARAALATTRRRAEIHRALAGLAGRVAAAVDVDAVTMVVESTLELAADAAAVARAVEAVRHGRPALFRATTPPTGGTMGARVERPATPLASAATEAARSGDRGSLMRYLRMRRGA